MGKWRKPGKEEVAGLRKRLAARASTGELRFPEAIVEIRKSLGMTQDEFSGLLGMKRRQIAEMETGKANPTVETLERVGRVFGFTVGFVPRLPDQPEPPPSPHPVRAG